MMRIDNPENSELRELCVVLGGGGLEFRGQFYVISVITANTGLVTSRGLEKMLEYPML